MRFMILVKANKDSEAGVLPSTELLTTMGHTTLREQEARLRTETAFKR